MAVMVVVVMMVPVAPEVMVMMVVMHLRELHSGFGRSCGRALVDHFQRRCRVRNGLQQVGIGIGLQYV
jgi:hypothetical protein